MSKQQLYFENHTGHLTNKELNVIAPEKSRFFPTEEKDAAIAEHRKHEGSIITKITNYSHKDVLDKGRVVDGAKKHLLGYLVQYPAAWTKGLPKQSQKTVYTKTIR